MRVIEHSSNGQTEAAGLRVHEEEGSEAFRRKPGTRNVGHKRRGAEQQCRSWDFYVWEANVADMS